MASIPRDTKRAIKDLRSAGVSQRKTASIVQANRDTVREYEPDEIPEPDPDFEPSEADYRELLSPEVNLAVALEEEFVPDDYDPDTAEEWQGEGPGSSPYQDETARDLYLRNDYSDLSPGEFIREFFEDFEVGVKTRFVNMQGRRADRRGEIPDQDKLYNDLQQMSSGIGNSDDARYIAEEYWAEAQRYLQQTDASVFRGADEEEDATRPEGSWVGPGSEQQGQWVEIPGHGMVYGTYQQGPNGAYQFQPMQPPSQQGGYPGMGQGGAGMGQGFPGPGASPYGGQQRSQGSDEIRELRDELSNLRREMAQGSGSDEEDNGPMAAITQLVEMKSALNQLQDDNGGAEDEAIQNLRREIRSMQQAIQQDAQQGQTSFSDPRDQVMSKLLAREDLDAETAMRIAQSFTGDSDDPEVRKKEIDKEVRLEELKQKRDRTESLISSFSEVAQDLGRGIGQALSNGGENAPQGQQGQPAPQGQQAQPGQHANAAYGQPAQQAQQANAAYGQQNQPAQPAQPAEPVGTGIEEWDCPECGTTTEQNPETPGVACENCDYSLMACPGCAHPVEVPPVGQPAAFACPDCQNPIDAPDSADDLMPCLNCDWVGTPRESGPEVVTCDSCESIHEVGRQHAPEPTTDDPDQSTPTQEQLSEEPVDLETDGGTADSEEDENE